MGDRRSEIEEIRQRLSGPLQVVRRIKRLLDFLRLHLPQGFEREAQFPAAFHDQRHGTGTDTVTLLGGVVADALLAQLNNTNDRRVTLHCVLLSLCNDDRFLVSIKKVTPFVSEWPRRHSKIDTPLISE